MVRNPLVRWMAFYGVLSAALAGCEMGPGAVSPASGPSASMSNGLAGAFGGTSSVWDAPTLNPVTGQPYSLVPTLGELYQWEQEHPRPINHPMWEGSTLLGNVRYSHYKDRRHTAQQRADFSINPDGEVSGQELIDIVHPAEKSVFEQAQRMSGFTGDAAAMDTLYHQYLVHLVNQGTAILVMNRILDNEAMKRMMPKEPTEDRSSYVARALLVQNAAGMGLIASHQEPVLDAQGQPMMDHGQPVTQAIPDSDIHPADEGRFYRSIHDMVNNRAVCFNMNWQFSDGGLGDAQHDLTHPSGDGSEMPLPPMTFEFRCGATVAPVCHGREHEVAVTQDCLPDVQAADIVHHIDEQGFYAGMIEIQSAYHRTQVQQWIQQAYDQVKPADIDALLKRHNADEFRRLITAVVDRLPSLAGETIDAEARRQTIERATQFALTADVQRFKDKLREMMKDTHTKMMRQAAWQTVIQENNPDVQWQMNISVTTEEMHRLYTEQKETAFRIDNYRAGYHEIEIHGPKAADFEKQFTDAMGALQMQVLQDTNAQLAHATPEQREQIRQHIFQLRREVPPQVVEQTKAKFAAEIASGALTVQINERQLQWSSNSDMTAPHTVAEKMQAQLMGNQIFGLVPYPIVTAVADGGVHFIGSLEQVDDLDHSYLPEDNDVVHNTLRNLILNKAQSFQMREMAYRMFRENRFVKMVDTCTTDPWPCQNVNSELWTNELFPESVYACRPGDDTRWCGAPVDQFGQTAPSTLGLPQQIMKVRSIDLSLFEQAFMVRNGR
ncbi:MAG TPA: hypothetical protein VL588_01725 [Bdellovibrionota bacterium]|nr:hypothetical protein [Bdellovibrionota bacterium]